jgi:hypothetical protein
LGTFINDGTHIGVMADLRQYALGGKRKDKFCWTEGSTIAQNCVASSVNIPQVYIDFVSAIMKFWVHLAEVKLGFIRIEIPFLF